MPTAGVNSLELYYEVHGDGEPLVCVIGLGDDSTAWGGVLPNWTAAWRAVVFDNRDSGRSTYTPVAYGVREMAADTLALADRLGLERFHVLGHSLGGAIAQELALAAPERVATLTLCATFGGADGWMRARAAALEARLPGCTDEQLLDELLLTSLAPRTWEHPSQVRYLRRLTLGHPHRQRRDGYVRQLRAGAGHEARERLGGLRMPVHVIGAECDLVVPVWRSRELGALIPGARLSILSGAGHALHVDDADALARSVQGFLHEHPLGPA